VQAPAGGLKIGAAAGLLQEAVPAASMVSFALM
jgi:hypothetical protein